MLQRFISGNNRGEISALRWWDGRVIGEKHSDTGWAAVNSHTCMGWSSATGRSEAQHISEEALVPQVPGAPRFDQRFGLDATFINARPRLRGSVACMIGCIPIQGRADGRG